MKRITIIILFSLVLFECHNADRDEIKRGQEQFFYFAALALYRPNFCEPPQLILEEGQTYNITLEEGKRFWFDYAVRSQGDISKNNYRLTINKNANATIDYQIKDCVISTDQGTREIISSSSTQVIYESESFRYDSPSSSRANYRFFLEPKTGSGSVSLIFAQF